MAPAQKKYYGIPGDWIKHIDNLKPTAQFLRFRFVALKLAWPLAKFSLLAAFGLSAFFATRDSYPRYHNYAIKKSYEDREALHVKYLKENPAYKEALLKGYDYLRPCK